MASDLSGAISKAWEGLKADHAAAAAQGPEAEARWWGKTIGRIGFEVGATFIPIAGQAGKVSTVAKGADVAVDAARAADKLVDVGHGAEVARTAEKMDGVIDLLSQAKRKLGSLPLNSKTLDDLFRAGKMSMDEARVLADEVGFKDKDGNWIYPPIDGFSAKPVKTQVYPPATIDRYGGFYKDGSFEDYGNFVSNAGASFASRALPPGTMTKPFKTYEVLHSFEALYGKATPWFNQPGGGTRYMTEHKIGKLIELGYIREVK